MTPEERARLEVCKSTRALGDIPWLIGLAEREAKRAHDLMLERNKLLAESERDFMSTEDQLSELMRERDEARLQLIEAVKRADTFAHNVEVQRRQTERVVEVEVQAAAMRVAFVPLVERMERMLQDDLCDCEQNAHICWRLDALREVEAARKALE